MYGRYWIPYPKHGFACLRNAFNMRAIVIAVNILNIQYISPALSNRAPTRHSYATHTRHHSSVYYRLAQRRCPSPLPASG